MWLNSKVGEENFTQVYHWREWGPWIVYKAGKFGRRGDTGL